MMGSLSSCDPGNIFNTIDVREEFKLNGQSLACSCRCVLGVSEAVCEVFYCGIGGRSEALQNHHSENWGYAIHLQKIWQLFSARVVRSVCYK